MTETFPRIQRKHIRIRKCDAIGYDYTVGAPVPLTEIRRRRLAA